jgi:hypothetical protein
MEPIHPRWMRLCRPPQIPCLKGPTCICINYLDKLKISAEKIFYLVYEIEPMFSGTYQKEVFHYLRPFALSYNFG